MSSACLKLYMISLLGIHSCVFACAPFLRHVIRLDVLFTTTSQLAVSQPDFKMEKNGNICFKNVWNTAELVELTPAWLLVYWTTVMLFPIRLKSDGGSVTLIPSDGCCGTCAGWRVPGDGGSGLHAVCRDNVTQEIAPPRLCLNE